MSAAKAISADVLDVLKRVECDGNQVVIAEQLDRKLYMKTAKVLSVLGGKWNRSLQATVFGEDAGPMIADAVSAGEYVDAKQLYQAFATPQAVCDKICDLAGVGGGMNVLEPSAGTGVLARTARALGAQVECVEIQDRLVKELEADGFMTFSADFLSWPVPQVPVADAVVMNPPFTRGQDMDHVRRAFDFLKPSRAMAFITSLGWTFRSDRKAVEFRQWQDDVGAEWEELPAGTFKDSGTNIATMIGSIRKAG